MQKGFSKNSVLRVKLLVCKFSAEEERIKLNKDPKCHIEALKSRFFASIPKKGKT